MRAALVSVLAAGCGGGEHLRECRSTNPTYLTCTPAGLVAPSFFAADLNPRVTDDWGCHFELHDGELVAIGEGAMCSDINWDNYDFGGDRHVSFPRNCGVPPPGAWTLQNAFGGELSVTVTATEFTCTAK